MDTIGKMRRRNYQEEFQWGHDFSAMDTVVRQRLLVDPANKFQWGHDFSAMDT